jgi:predicted lactoylglutathione lyase
MIPQKTFFINFHSADIDASTRFATALGLTKSKHGCSEGKSAMFGYGDNLQLGYHGHSMFSSWLPSGKTISSAGTAETIVTLSVGSREDVDALIEKGIVAGGKRGPNMVPDGEKWGLYSRSVEDPDGHLFEIIYCEEDAQEGGK